MSDSHISYVQVGPDFIHWRELQCAGIQDEFQFFNEHQVLSLAAPRHSAHTQTLTFNRRLRCSCRRSPPTLLNTTAQWEAWAGGCFWTLLHSKISSPCSVCSLWLEVALFDVTVGLIGLLTDPSTSVITRVHQGSHQNKTREGVNTAEHFYFYYHG